MAKYLHLASFSIFLIAFVGIFLPTWLSLFERWGRMDESYSHGYLVLAISIYYIFQNIRLIDPDKVRVNYFAVLGLLFCSLFWSLSYHASIGVLQQILLPVLLLLFFVFMLGFNEGKKFIFPVLFLFFAIPVWDYLIESLQFITVFVNGLWLDLSNIPAYIEGVFVTIAAGNFEVAGGCSGLRYLLIALTLATLYSYQNYSHWLTKVLLFLTAFLFSLLANWLRVYFIIVVGHVTDMQSGLIEEHEFFGWVLFAMTLVPFFYLADRYAIWFKDEGLLESKKTETGFMPYKVMPYIIACLATFAIPLLLSLSSSSAADNNRLAKASLVFNGEPLTDVAQLIHPVFKGADIEIDQVFNVNDKSLQVSLRRYTEQKPGKELVYYGNHMYSNLWRVIQGSSDQPFAFLKLEHRDSGQKILLASQYAIGTYKVNNKTYAKLLELFKPLMSSPFSGVLIIATPCRDSCESAQDRIELFLSDNEKLIKDL